LQHPGVAQVLEAATDENGEPYTVVEYVEGRSLSDLRQRTVQTGMRLAWPDAVAMAIEIAQALAHVHERAGADGTPLGIVHRDLSPQNVMVGYAGEIKLIDFGTARGHNRRCHTVAGVVFAKPGYVAPEVARQQVGDGRIDIYALGIVLWELCAGRRFLTTDPGQHLDDAARGRLVVPPIAAACGAPIELDEVVATLTKNDPDERYARASAAVTGLAKLLSGAPASEGGERGVRARIALVMRRLWPNDPARSRAEFARLLREGRLALEKTANQPTPDAGPVSAAIAVRMVPEDPRQLAGTPYRIVRKIGEGANGVVYEAEHVELGRAVALKVLASEHARSPASLERFRREARAVANLSHPHLVQLFDFGRSLDGRAFLAMELCQGETLDARLRRGPLPWQEAVRIAIETARALEAAHATGIVHRDIKPQNLMLTRSDGTQRVGPTKLLDFGIATALTPTDRAATGAEKALRGFAVVGTPEYMAPEQVAGDPVDRRTDIYALACVLYEMLTGVRAFEGPSTVVVMGMQIRDTPPPPRLRAPSGRSGRRSRHGQASGGAVRVGDGDACGTRRRAARPGAAARARSSRSDGVSVGGRDDRCRGCRRPLGETTLRRDRRVCLGAGVRTGRPAECDGSVGAFHDGRTRGRRTRQLERQRPRGDPTCAFISRRRSARRQDARGHAYRQHAQGRDALGRESPQTGSLGEARQHNARVSRAHRDRTATPARPCLCSDAR
jgi:serine/threonine-protein kinase